MNNAYRKLISRFLVIALTVNSFGCVYGAGDSWGDTPLFEYSGSTRGKSVGKKEEKKQLAVWYKKPAVKYALAALGLAASGYACFRYMANGAIVVNSDLVNGDDAENGSKTTQEVVKNVSVRDSLGKNNGLEDSASGSDENKGKNVDLNDTQKASTVSTGENNSKEFTPAEKKLDSIIKGTCYSIFMAAVVAIAVALGGGSSQTP
jgi:hypothetical protein